MPLLFFLAGCSTYFALHKRTAGQYAWERVKRLLVPFIFGILVLTPPQGWYGARFNSGYTESYWHYLSSGDFLKWNIQDGGDYYGGLVIGQLWFILWLLLISLILLPLMVWAVRGRASTGLQRLSRRLSHPAWWLAPVIFLFLAEAAPEQVGKPSVLYAFAFLLGALVVADPKFPESAERFRFPAFLGGIALTRVLGGVDRLPEFAAGPLLGPGGTCHPGQRGPLAHDHRGDGDGQAVPEPTSVGEKYLAEASYPVYIIHQTVIVILAFYIVDFAIPMPAQWVVLLALSVAGTFALYEIVRRVNVFRFLLGMRQRRKAA